MHVSRYVVGRDIAIGHVSLWFPVVRRFVVGFLSVYAARHRIFLSWFC